LVQGHFGSWAYSFPLTKALATLLTYWSGIAGGIFAPSLSIGSSLGADLGQWLGFAVPACSMVGMAAFLSGTIQAPITAFVIIFEMTGHHSMLLPIMISSLTAFIVARIFGARHLYQSLALNYQWLLEPAKKLT
jgi:H+/Cl- antiporter ClcA